MLLNSVIIILREVLEAAILVSLLLALSFSLRLGARWLLWAILPALLGIVGMATFIDTITDAFDGAGQELTNASLQILVYCFSLLIVSVSAGLIIANNKTSLLRWLMALAVVCALIREGSEIFIYVAGFSSAEELRAAVFIGSGIGASIGISLGVLILSGLHALTPARTYQVTLLLLSFIAAGMVMQATILLQQVDWLPSGKPLWNSSHLISEQSITGELLYAVFGYESTPTTIQVVIYSLSLIGIALPWLGRNSFWNSKHVD
ncbi:MAG: FTR1 family protein [Spongiibacteraceae bacterium]